MIKDCSFFFFQDSPSLRSPSSSKDTFSKRLSGNTEFIASRLIEKVNESTGNIVTSPNSSVLDRSHSFQSDEKRRSSHSSETHSDYSDKLSFRDSGIGSGSKVTDRWQYHIQETSGAPKSPLANSELHSRGSSYDNSYIHSRGSSYDVRISFFHTTK